MDILDQTLERMERELYAVLERSTDPKIMSLIGDIKSIKATKEILGRQGTAPVRASLFSPTVTTNGRGNAAAPMTQGDAAAEILRKAGRSMHISEILGEMENLGIRPTSRVNLNGILVKDRRNRFINKGQATFALNPNARGATENKQKPLPGLPRGFSLTESVKALLPDLKGEFGQPDIYKMLRERHPEAANRIQKASISTTLTKMVGRGLIEVTEMGHGSQPRQYITKGR
jgi:hypothetical protein